MIDLSTFEAEAQQWGISTSDRFELEELIRPNDRQSERLRLEELKELEFRDQVSDVMISAGLLAKANRYRVCSQFGHIVECEGEERHRFYTLEYCGLRFCPRCGGRLFKRLLAKYAPVLNYVAKHQQRGFRLRIVTLTSRNTGELNTVQIKSFNKSIKKTLRLLMEGVVGWGAIWVNEIGRDNTNLHAHVLLYSPYIKQTDLSRVWQAISGNPVVWINQAAVIGPKALCYLLKYVSKPPSDNPEFLGRLEVAFHRVRRVHTLALFYNFSGDDQDHELAHWKLCPLCGSMLNTAGGVLTLEEIASRHLSFIGEIRSGRNERKWEN